MPIPYVVSSACCAGVVSSSIIQRYSCRVSMILGSLIMTTGYVMSAFATSLQMIFVTYGIVVGRYILYNVDNSFTYVMISVGIYVAMQTILLMICYLLFRSRLIDIKSNLSYWTIKWHIQYIFARNGNATLQPLGQYYYNKSVLL